MQYRSLGRCGLKVSTLMLGTMTFGGRDGFAKVGMTDLTGARRQIDMCLEAGVNMIDTADIYSFGLSEEIVGEALAGRRGRMLIATKARFPTGDKGANDRGAARHHLMRACDESLRRLGTDHIDVYWLHAWDGQTPLEETLRAIEDLTRSGKIGHLGVSNYSGWHLMKMLATAERERIAAPVAQQIYYSLVGREAEYELLPIAVDQGIGAAIWSPLAGGLLSGKYRRGVTEPGDTRRAAKWMDYPVQDKEQFYDLVELLIAIADGHDASPAQVALAWLLTRNGVCSAIVGARSDEQLADNLKAAELALTPDEVARIDAASKPPLIYPYWHQRGTIADRMSAADRVTLAPHQVG